MKVYIPSQIFVYLHRYLYTFTDIYIPSQIIQIICESEQISKKLPSRRLNKNQINVGNIFTVAFSPISKLSLETKKCNLGWLGTSQQQILWDKVDAKYAIAPTWQGSTNFVLQCIVHYLSSSQPRESTIYSSKKF